MTQAPPEQRTAPSTGRRAPALAAELRMAIMRTSRRLRQERSTDDVTPGQYSVLAVLDRHGPCTPRELALHEKVQPPSMTRTVTALAELGLVDRTMHPTDGRQVLVSLTEPGRVVVRETRRRRDAWLVRRLAEITTAERETLSDAAVLLQRMAQA